MALHAVRTTLAAAVLAVGGVQALPAGAETSAPVLIYTRATVQSVFNEGAKHYIRLKLGPGSGLPFRTQTFRLRDPAVAVPFPPGTGVEFVARRIDGENTLTELRAAPKLLRFESH